MSVRSKVDGIVNIILNQSTSTGQLEGRLADAVASLTRDGISEYSTKKGDFNPYSPEDQEGVAKIVAELGEQRKLDAQVAGLVADFVRNGMQAYHEGMMAKIQGVKVGSLRTPEPKLQRRTSDYTSSLALPPAELYLGLDPDRWYCEAMGMGYTSSDKTLKVLDWGQIRAKFGENFKVHLLRSDDPAEGDCYMLLTPDGMKRKRKGKLESLGFCHVEDTKLHAGRLNQNYFEITADFDKLDRVVKTFTDVPLDERRINLKEFAKRVFGWEFLIVDKIGRTPDIFRNARNLHVVMYEPVQEALLKEGFRNTYKL